MTGEVSVGDAWPGEDPQCGLSTSVFSPNRMLDFPTEGPQGIPSQGGGGRKLTCSGGKSLAFKKGKTVGYRKGESQSGSFGLKPRVNRVVSFPSVNQTGLRRAAVPWGRSAQEED